MIYEIKSTSKRLLLQLLMLVGFTLAADFLYASDENMQARYYRYIDENGVKTTAARIPPQYVQKGYDIITRSGKIIKVPPAPAPEDVKEAEELLARQREETAEYEILARRYSSVHDIYSARDRRLTHLNASISILKNNIVNIKRQIGELTSKAADSERAGRNVPTYLLQSLVDAKTELQSTEAKLSMRTLEHDEIHQSFEDDVKLFEKGRAFLEARRLEANN